jgi:tripartite-type tricarboxylate transporter receptor subunit TctC
MLHLLSCLLLSFAVAAAHAQPADLNNPAPDYPNRPVRLIVNAPPGGGTDILGRLIAQHLTAAFGQQFVVDNRGGAGGIIGTETVARAQPDGYTLLMAFTSHVINPSLRAKLPYDTVKDFAPVAFVATVPNVMVVHPKMPLHNVGEVLAYVRAHPGKLAYASAGAGSASHLAGVMFEVITSTKLLHVAYKGGAPAQAAVISGEVPFAFANAVSAIPHVRSGRLRGLATTGLRRSKAMPDLPTVDEAGVNGYEANAWFGVYAPAGVTAPILTKINAEIRRGLDRPDMQANLARQSAEANPMSVPEFTAFIRKEIERWRKIVEASGARVD